MVFLRFAWAVPALRAPAREAAGTAKVQAEDFHDQIRPGLIAHLPRLKRFADVVVGERAGATALLRRALNVMLAEQHRYRRDRALDAWAFAEIYATWLAEVSDAEDPEAQQSIAEGSLAALIGRDADWETVRFLAGLPVEHRLMLLLVYGEGFDYAEAGRVLDISADMIAARLIRISAAFADRLCAARRRKRTAGAEAVDRSNLS